MKIVTKPWGKEEWLELNPAYCYKRIYINAGHKTSYQYHNYKYETNYIISGEAEIWLENDIGVVEKKIMKEGEFFNVPPPKKHRVIALTDLILQEVSTPEVDDVVRMEDDTNRSDGKIESEHIQPAVLIICAGLGTRLGDLTKNINKTLLPVNNKAIISHIIGYFPSNSDFIITKGYKGDTIEEYCKITHPNHKFTFVEIDNFEGEGTGPGYSTLKCKEYLQRPFYFITGDCMHDSLSMPEIDCNWLGIFPTVKNKTYSTILLDDNNNILKFKNKSNDGYQNSFIGLGGILDYEVFWKELENNIKNGEIVSAFYNPENYPALKGKRFIWLDTGDESSLFKTKEYFNDKPLSLQKNTNEITYKDNGKFIKFTPNKKILENRLERGKHLKNVIPENLGSTDHFMYYDWFEGKTLYELDDIDVFVKFLGELDKNIKRETSSRYEDIKSFYIDKTTERVKLFLTKFNNHYYFDEFNINGKNYKSMTELTPKTLYKDDEYSYSLFHGDLQFDNVVYNTKTDKFAYIDWRDSFGNSTDMGAVYYDLAKLYGGLLIPYNLMKNDNNVVLIKNKNNIHYTYPISENLVTFLPMYEEWLKNNGFDLHRVRYMTGIVFLNMSPLHDENFGELLWFKSIEMLSEYENR